MPERQASGEDDETEELCWGGPAAKVTDSVIAAEELDKKAEGGISDEISGEHLAFQFPAAIEPGQAGVEGEVEQGFVDLGGMDREGVGFMSGGIADGPRQIAGATEAAAIHETAKAAEGMAERNAGCHDVGHFHQGQTFGAGEEETSDRRADEPAVKDQSAFAEHEDFPPGRLSELLIPVRDDVENSSADQGADDQPWAQIHDALGGESLEGGTTRGGPDAGQESGGNEYAVPVNGKVTELKCDFFHAVNSLDFRDKECHCQIAAWRGGSAGWIRGLWQGWVTGAEGGWPSLRVMAGVE